PRVKAPVLMLNGRFDYIFPTATCQEPMFRFLGTSPEHKRRVVYDTAHDIPRPEAIKESLDWLDRYIGPGKNKDDLRSTKLALRPTFSCLTKLWYAKIPSGSHLTEMLALICSASRR